MTLKIAICRLTGRRVLHRITMFFLAYMLLRIQLVRWKGLVLWSILEVVTQVAVQQALASPLSHTIALSLCYRRESPETRRSGSVPC